MFLWYGLLYSILGVLKNRKVKITEIGEDIRELYGYLKDCRNALFHPQSDYYSIKLFRIVMKEGTPEKILKINESLGGYFLSEIEERQRGG